MRFIFTDTQHGGYSIIVHASDESEAWTKFIKRYRDTYIRELGEAPFEPSTTNKEIRHILEHDILVTGPNIEELT